MASSSSHQAAGTQSKPTGLFTNQDFLNPAKQVEKPNLNGWDFYVESVGLKIYRRYKSESGLYEYKVHGVMPSLDPEQNAMVYLDWEYRKKWDDYVKDLYTIKDKDTEGLYWAVAYPWPLTNRDYTYIREGRILEVGGRRTWVVVARSHYFSRVPEKKNHVRVDDFHQSVAIQSDGKSGSRVFMHYYDNPKGNIPTWLINWAAKTAVPKFIANMTNAVKGYKHYLRTQGKEWPPADAEKYWGRQEIQ